MSTPSSCARRGSRTKTGVHRLGFQDYSIPRHLRAQMRQSRSVRMDPARPLSAEEQRVLSPS